MQVDTAQGLGALQAAQVSRVAQHQGRRQHGLTQQGLLAIGIDQDAIEQVGALGNAALQPRPLLGEISRGKASRTRADCCPGRVVTL